MFLSHDFIQEKLKKKNERILLLLHKMQLLSQVV